ncbi:MAG: hypothetical protein ABH846_01910, partial [Patescibacteria group bacterium]
GGGKSVFCRLMQSSFENVSRLKFDDFFKNIDDVDKLGPWTCWDSPDSIKWDELVQATTDLRAGRYAIVPNYSRKDDKAVGEKCVFPAPIMLVDGFMTLVDERLRDLLDLKIFFNLSEDSQIKRRRIRQSWVEDGYLHEVMIPGSRKFIMPSKQYADYVINAEMSPQAVADHCISIIRNEIGSEVKKLANREIIKTTTLKAKV